MSPEQMRAIVAAIADWMVETSPMSGVLAVVLVVAAWMLVSGYVLQRRGGCEGDVEETAELPHVPRVTRTSAGSLEPGVPVALGARQGAGATDRARSA